LETLRNTRDTRRRSPGYATGCPGWNRNHDGLQQRGDDPTLGELLGLLPTGRVSTINGEGSKETQQLLQTIKANYEKNPLTRSMLASPENHKNHFHINNELIWTKNFRNMEVICVLRENSLITQLLRPAYV
jgi:hypothetical protein